MPTKKPIIQTVVSEELHKKFKLLAKKELRTDSQMANYIITKYINQYEKEHGKINITKEE